MNPSNLTDNLMRGPLPLAGESIGDYRERVAAYQAQAAERRELELLEQRSSTHTPSERIRIWERLHQLALPRSLSHRLVDVIADQTGLSSEDVRDEQRLRAK